jgi:hypothetical protein
MKDVGTGEGTQEFRSERVSLAVTPREKAALSFVADVKRCDGAGTLLREMSLTEVMAEHVRLVERMREELAAGAEAVAA